MRRLASLLILSGAGICVLGAVGLAYGAWLTLSPRAIRAIGMTIPFILGGVLLLVGALVGRAARREGARSAPP